MFREFWMHFFTGFLIEIIGCGLSPRKPIKENVKASICVQITVMDVHYFLYILFIALIVDRRYQQVIVLCFMGFVSLFDFADNGCWENVPLTPEVH